MSTAGEPLEPDETAGAASPDDGVQGKGFGETRESAAAPPLSEELREARSRYRALVAGLLEGVVVQDADGSIFACNKTASVLLGKVDWKGQAWSWDLHREDMTSFSAQDHPVARAFAQGRPQRNVLVGVVLPNNRFRWLSMCATPVFKGNDTSPYSVVATLKDVTEKTLVTDWQTVEARIDGFTGLSNRRYFSELGFREISRAARYATGLCLLLLDVDSLRAVNEQHGHASGDIALRAVASECLETVRSQDSCARIDEDEFAILLPHTGIVAARLLAERLRTNISSRAISLVNKTMTRVTVSIGISELGPTARPLTEVLAEATQALQLAKQTGRNKVLVAPACLPVAPAST
jgi:diguanylate cyclase (GGDEF)-like protein